VAPTAPRAPTRHRDASRAAHRRSPARRRGGRGCPGTGQRGSATVEFTILFPIIVVLLLAGPQLVLWYFARETAQAAASAAARAATVSTASAADGRAAADSYLTRVGRDTITSYRIEETHSATTVTVHIRVTVPAVIPLPGFTPAADVTITRDTERFTTPDNP
jgi:Flp pilus assembly protein TadG